MHDTYDQSASDAETIMREDVQTFKMTTSPPRLSRGVSFTCFKYIPNLVGQQSINHTISDILNDALDAMRVCTELDTSRSKYFSSAYEDLTSAVRLTRPVELFWYRSTITCPERARGAGAIFPTIR